MFKFIGMIVVILMLASCCEAETTAVTFTWTAPGDDSTVGTCAAYDIRYGISNITDSSWSLAGLIPESMVYVPSIAGTSESLTVNLELSSEETYYFRIKAMDEATNWSNLSNEVSLYIPDNVPPAIIINFNAVKQ